MICIRGSHTLCYVSCVSLFRVLALSLFLSQVVDVGLMMMVAIKACQDDEVDSAIATPQVGLLESKARLGVTF